MRGLDSVSFSVPFQLKHSKTKYHFQNSEGIKRPFEGWGHTPLQSNLIVALHSGIIPGCWFIPKIKIIPCFFVFVDFNLLSPETEIFLLTILLYMSKAYYPGRGKYHPGSSQYLFKKNTVCVGSALSLDEVESSPNKVCFTLSRMDWFIFCHDTYSRLISLGWDYESGA